MNFKDFAMNLVTLGGYEQLEAAKATYASVYREYEDNRNRLYYLERTRIDNLSNLGELVIDSFKSAKKARKILRYVDRCHAASLPEKSLRSAEFGQEIRLNNVDRIIEEYSSSVSVAGGAGAGAAVAAGSWSLVALIGSASTGTAISTLSGVAATNATLAWFGGGALAAGGAGMAGGTLVLGGVALAPVVAIAAWHSRSKTKEINQETESVRYADLQTRQAIGPTQSAINVINSCLGGIRPSADVLQWEADAAKCLLFPIWGWSLSKRFLARLIGKPFYSDEEREILDSLELALMEFTGCFQRMQDGGHTNGGVNEGI
ncbi:hypothetical protein [Sphingobium sp. MI1205]|uniref:hypothetical protein n=2 Tax=unclassified Sphingobium TaxID=2611147 RepID=UPI000A6A2E72|nr:hypothetical protein [Sphingobium sp. MI1205]